MKGVIDTLVVDEAGQAQQQMVQDIPEEERKKTLLKASAGLPPVTAFTTAESEYETDTVDYSVDTSGLIQGLNEEFLAADLSAEQLGKFGFHSMKDFEKLSVQVRDNLLLGMKLYFA